MNMILAIFWTGHLLADFFFQSAKIAEKKQEDRRYMLMHSIIYSIVFAVIGLGLLELRYALVSVAVIAVTHMLIDWGRVEIDRRADKPSSLFVSFVIDQILHIGIITGVYYGMNLRIHMSSWCETAAEYPSAEPVVWYSLLFLFLLNPSAVFIKKLFAYLFGNNVEAVASYSNAGSIIGKLERVITAIFLLCDQYGAVGLVLTAKSIARFKQLEEKDFAEKYLIGTLTSLMISLIATFAVKKIV